MTRTTTRTTITLEDIKRRGACGRSRRLFKQAFPEGLTIPDPYHDWDGYFQKMHELTEAHPDLFQRFNESIAREYALREIRPKQLAVLVPIPPAKYVLEDTVGVPRHIMHSKLTGRWNCDAGSKLELGYCSVSDLEMYGNRFGDLDLKESAAARMFLNFGELGSLHLTRTHCYDCMTRGKKTLIHEFMSQYSVIMDGEFNTLEALIRWSELLRPALRAKNLEAHQSYMLGVTIKAEFVHFCECRIFNTRVNAPKVRLHNCSGEVFVPDGAEVDTDGSIKIMRDRRHQCAHKDGT